jgi:hypothetical protein
VKPRSLLLALAGLLPISPLAAVETLPAPVMLTSVVPWAQALSQRVLAQGEPLDPSLLCAARAVGVRDPAKVRVHVVDAIPLPDDPALRVAAIETGISADRAGAMTLGHAILVLRGERDDPRLLRHELRHVAQYEQAGGIAAFLSRHLPDLVRHGYDASSYEVDARAHEARIAACDSPPRS